MNELWYIRLTRTYRPCTDQFSLGKMQSVSRHAEVPASTNGAPAHQHALYTCALIGTYASFDNIWHHPYPSPRSLRSQKSVYARARDASVKTQPGRLVRSEDLHAVYMIMYNMFVMFIREGLS